nr:hypothetical protein [Xanthomonas euvesicatoria]
MQPTLSDAEGLGKRKQTRREIFLAEMERMIPWKKLLPLIEPHYPVSGWQGLQPDAVSTILRISLLQQRYALINPALKQMLHGVSPLRQFAQLGGLTDITN